MLLYESSACLHGRRQKFKGKYYASVFAHYQPIDPAVWNFTKEVLVWGNEWVLSLVYCNVCIPIHKIDLVAMIFTLSCWLMK